VSEISKTMPPATSETDNHALSRMLPAALRSERRIPSAFQQLLAHVARLQQLAIDELRPRPGRIRTSLRMAFISAVGAALMAALHINSVLGPDTLWVALYASNSLMTAGAGLVMVMAAAALLIARLSAASPSRPLLTTVTAIEVILIIAAYLALASYLAPGAEIFVVCLSLALGLQNAAFRRTGGISVHTTYLTGMITGLIATEAERHAFHVAPGASTVPDPKFGLLYGIWGTFVLGAGTGAAMVLHFKELGILGAALVLFAIIVRNSMAASRAHSSS